MSLLAQMEKLFLHTEHRVVSAYAAMKCEAPRGSGRGRGKLPQPTGKARALCLTVQRRSSTRGFKATLHICKEAQGQYEVRKSLRLKSLARMEVFRDAAAAPGMFELAFVQRGFTGGDARYAFELRSDAARLELLGSLYSFCTSQEHHTPVVAGISLAELDPEAEAEAQQKEEQRGGAGHDAPASAARAAALAAAAGSTQPASRPAGGAAAAEADAAALWATREDAQLSGLLDAVSVGASSVEELRGRLVAELSALEDASVHDVLESGPAAERAVGELGSTLALLDDLDEALAMFDAKLRHMRGDVAAIEGRNNRLEARSRNSAALATALEGVAALLVLAPGSEEALQSLEFTTSNLEAIVEAAWDLHRHLQALSAEAPPAPAPLDSEATAPSPAATRRWDSSQSGAALVPTHVPRTMQGMAAVAARRRQMQGLLRIFLDRATDYLARELQHIADADAQAAAAAQGRDRLRLVPHSGIHQRAVELGALLEVVAALRPSAAAPMRDHFCRAVNALLRKEADGARKELLKQAAAGEAAATPEPELSLRSVDSIRTLERISSTPARQPTAAALRDSPQRAASAHAKQQHASAAAPGGIGLHDAYATLLATLLPLLAAEAKACVGLMCAGASAEAAEAAVEALLQGIDAAIVGVIEAVKPPKALPVLPMLAATLTWQGRMEGRPGAAPLVALLRRCERKLRAAWEDFTAERVAAIQRYDGKSAMSGAGAKGVHVLPFVITFQAVATRIEDLLAQCAQEDAQAGSAAGLAAHAAPSSALLRPSPFASGGPPRRRTTTDSIPEGDEAASEAPDVSFMSDSSPGGLNTPGFGRLHAAASSGSGAPSGAGMLATPGSVTGPSAAPRAGAAALTEPRPSATVRAAADSFYERVLTAAVAAVEQHAESDAKRSARLRLENYSFLRLALQGLPAAQGSALQRHCTDAAARRNTALAVYTEQRLAELKLSPLLELGQRLAAAKAEGSSSVGVAPPSAQELRNGAAAGVAGGLDKRAAAVRSLLHKHLAGSSPYLIGVVWERLENQCLEAWAALEEALAALNPGVALALTGAELRQALQRAASAAD